MDEKYYHVILKWGQSQNVWEILPSKTELGKFRKPSEKYYHVNLKWGH